MTPTPPSTDEEGRLVLTLVPPASTTARAMAERLGVRVPELVRRSLSLMRLWLSLETGEYLAVRRANGDLERILLWADESHA